jgi:hypothetical protein
MPVACSRGLRDRWIDATIRNVVTAVDGNISSTKPARSMEFHALHYEALRVEKFDKKQDSQSTYYVTLSCCMRTDGQTLPSYQSLFAILRTRLKSVCKSVLFFDYQEY